MLILKLAPVLVVAGAWFAAAGCGSNTAPNPGGGAEWESIERTEFRLDYASRDQAMAPTWAGYADGGVSGAQSFFGAAFPHGFTIRVYPDRSALTAHWRSHWSSPGFSPECWMVAAGDADEVSLLSPAVWSVDACGHDATNAEHVRMIVAHEIVHVYHGQANRRFRDAQQQIPWFVEGVAVFVSGQMVEHMGAAEQVFAGGTPANLEEIWSRGNAYGNGGALVSYVADTYGNAKVTELLAASSKTEWLTILGVSEAALLQAWGGEVNP
jgi:hypothetical protein